MDEEEAGDGLPVKFVWMMIKKSILSKKDYGNYTCVATGDNSVAHAVVQLKNSAGL